MNFLRRFFSETSTAPNPEAKVVLTDHEAGDLLFRLQVEADMHYHDATKDETKARSPKGLNALLEILGQAKADRDFDALSIYEEFPIFHNWALERAIPDLRRALGVRNLSGVITQKHLDVHRKALVAFCKEGHHDPKNPMHTDIFNRLNSLLFNERFQQADTIVELMAERKVYSSSELCALVDVSTELAAPLASGAL